MKVNILYSSKNGSGFSRTFRKRKTLLILRLKEICHEAGVNRSTFYLHYETLDDLLKESVEYMNRHFLNIWDKIHEIL